MKARLFVTAVLLGVFAGCAHQHDKGSDPEVEVDEEALADEIYHELCDDLEHPPYYASSLRWGSVFRGMVAIGVLPEEADHQVRRSARSTVSARDVDKLLDKHEADAEAFLDALDEAHLAAGSPAKKGAEDEFPYGLPSDDAVERWHEIATLADRPPRCGNALHWLPVYKDLMRLGFSAVEAESFCKRAILVGMSRFSAEELIDGSKRDTETFAEGFEAAIAKVEFQRSRVRSWGVKAFFKGKTYKPKKKPEALDVGADAPGAEAGETLETPSGDEAPAEGAGDEAPADGMGDEAPADGMGDEPPADVPEGE